MVLDTVFDVSNAIFVEWFMQVRDLVFRTGIGTLEKQHAIVHRQLDLYGAFGNVFDQTAGLDCVINRIA